MGENIDQVRSAVLNELREEFSGSLLGRKRRPVQAGTPYRNSTRSDNDDLIERPTVVVFGMGEKATEFELWPKPHLEADEWRMATLRLLNHARPLLMQDLAAGTPEEVANTGQAIMNLANLFIAGAIPAMVEQVFTWENTLPRDRILIELEATDTQLATAFLACLQLAFPFYSTLKEVSRLIQGSQSQTAETSKQTPANPGREARTDGAP